MDAVSETILHLIYKRKYKPIIILKPKPNRGGKEMREMYN